MLNSKRENETIDLEIVCVYNDEKVFWEELINSLLKQETKYNVRINGIDNTQGKYLSMAEAYNSVLELLKGRWTIFLHQDIVFNSKDSLDGIVHELEKIDTDSIVGSAGVIRNTRKTIVTEGTPIEAETVDECFFGMTTERFKELKFNEQLCDNWHMYAAEICLHNKCLNGKVLIIKADITHLSPGVISKEYVKTLYKLIDFYKKLGVESIWTTCAKVDLKGPYKVYILIWGLKHEVLNKIIRPLKW